MKFNSVSNFASGFLIASFIFGSAAFAISVDNTPSGGYLLCYNSKTKIVTYPNSLKCPKGTKPLELGARGESGIDGLDGADGEDGRNGRDGIDGNRSVTFNSYIKSQDVVVTDTVKGKRVVVLKASELIANASTSNSFLFDATVSISFPSAITRSSDKWAFCAWRDASDWSTSEMIYGKGSSAQILGTIFTSTDLDARAVMSVNANSDKFLTCTLYGTGQITGGYVTAQETQGSFRSSVGA